MSFLVSPTVRTVVGPVDSLDSDSLPWEGDTLAAGGGAANTPLKIPGLYAWYRADLGLSVTGGSVSVWADQSGNGLDLTQLAAAQQPVVAPDAGFGGQPVITFDGINDELVGASAADWPLLDDGTGVTVVLVARGNAPATTDGWWGTNNLATDIGAQMRQTAGNTVVWTLGNGAAFVLSQNIQLGYTQVPFYTTLRYEEGRPGNEFAWRWSGGADTIGDSTNGPSPGNPASPLSLGSRGGALFGALSVAELMVYSRYLSNVNAAQLDTYIRSRYTLS